MASEQEWAELVRATEMLLTGTLPKVADAIYLPGLSQGMIASGSLFEVVLELRHSLGPEGRLRGAVSSGFANIPLPIAFNGSDGRGMPPQDNPGAAWPGSDWYIKEFLSRGVDEFDLRHLVPTQPGLHTRGEQDALVTLAKERYWKQVVIVTVPWHFVQVFSCLVAAMKEQEYWFAAYAKAAETNWYVPMKGSQGLEDSNPFDESVKYSPKVHVYQERGFSAPFDELFSYLRSRESLGTPNV